MGLTKKSELTDRNNLLHKEPTVIDEKLLKEALEKVLPDDEIGAMAKKDGVKPKNATELTIEFKNIAQMMNIDHMVNLRKLQLCNNIIGKIENISTLIHLVHLDLSFNNIRRIENISTLKNIEVLNLHHNLITRIEGLDELLKLEILILSSNEIQQINDAKYLRKFVRLRSVSFQGNPVCSNVNFRSKLLAYVPQLTRINYRMVPPEEKVRAREKYSSEINHIEEKEDHLRRRASVVEAEEKVMKIHEDAFVSDFSGDNLWSRLFDPDPDGRLLLTIGDTEDFQEMYQELFRRASKGLFDKGMRAYKSRENEMTSFDTSMKEEKDDVRDKGIKLTEGFLQYELETLREMRGIIFSMEDLQRKYGTFEDDLPEEYFTFRDELNSSVLTFVRNLSQIWFSVMEDEIHLNEQILEKSRDLQVSIRDLVESWSELLKSNFVTLHDLQRQYNDKLAETLMTEGEFRIDLEHLPETIRKEIGDQPDSEWLKEKLSNSNEIHIQVLNELEGQMMDKMKKWLEETLANFYKYETHRNRMKISEISHFVDYHRKKLDDLKITKHTSCSIPEIRGDQNAKVIDVNVNNVNVDDGHKNFDPDSENEGDKDKDDQEKGDKKFSSVAIYEFVKRKQSKKIASNNKSKFVEALKLSASSGSEQTN